MMGIITVEQIVSVDGFAAEPDGGLSFFEAAPFEDDDRTDSAQMRWLETVDAILLGRRTYEMFAAYWPEADPATEAVAVPIARLPKHVVSRTLDRAPWGDGEIDVVPGLDEAAALRERFSSIAVWGSLELTRGLFDAGLVDVLRLRVVPVLIGSGWGFAPPDLPQTALRLEHTETAPTGHVLLQYRVAR
ncbi:reductase [Microbacterium sp. MEC084]|uniref:dihydrofolate reductase family protein n=1 Tax=Microbacterium sp. MEC084 TaxID=1963027 RepID=UPI001070356D|nr:dihydrofolate reductase family protein [Microbacterium sp. MEC084]MCD1269078.1 reductase [Microbacterium sp. MEC084]